MSDTIVKTTKSLRSRLFGRITAPAAEGGAPPLRPLMRMMGQMREAIVAPLRPFPLAHVASGSSFGMPCASPSDTCFLRECTAAAPPPMSASALQHAHRLMSQLPAWLSMPETRRNGQGQVVLSWQGEQSRHFSVAVGPDGMLIYSARLGSRGRFDGAEPIGRHLSPIILHAIDQLRDKAPVTR